MNIFVKSFIIAASCSLAAMDDKEALERQYVKIQIEALKEQLKQARIHNSHSEALVEREGRIKEIELQIQELMLSQKLETVSTELTTQRIMVDEKAREYRTNIINRSLNAGFRQALEAAPQVAAQVVVQTVTAELTQAGIEKTKEFFNPELRETKEFIQIMSRLKHATEKFQLMIDAMNTNYKHNIEMLKKNPEDAAIKEMVEKLEIDMQKKKRKLLQKHNALVTQYTNQLVELACKDEQPTQPQLNTAQKIALGGAVLAAGLAGYNYLK